MKDRFNAKSSIRKNNKIIKDVQLLISEAVKEGRVVFKNTGL